MANAFRQAGGRVEFQLLPPVGDEGHLAIFASGVTPAWGPIVEKFLAKSK
jgi:hypothetical protein